MLEHSIVIDWLKQPSREVQVARLTAYVKLCKGQLTDQMIGPEGQRHWTHILCWRMERSFCLIRTALLRVRGIGLTSYIGTYKNHLTHQDIPLGRSEVQDLQTFIGTYDWSGNSSWEVRGCGLTVYVKICQNHLTDEDIPPENSEALDSQTMLEYAKVIWLIRIFPWKVRSPGLTAYVETCNSHLTNQYIPPEKSEVVDSLSMLENAKIIWLIRTSLLRC
jgi:hypothetical protein